MSDTEDAREGVFSCLSSVQQPWNGPCVVTDLAPICCEAHRVQVRKDRPCIWLDNVITSEECSALIKATEEHHQSLEGEVPSDPGCRSQFCSNDPELSRMLWDRIKDTVPQSLDGGKAIGLMEVIAHAKYFAGQVGFPHMDFRHGPTDKKVASRISFTVYLNDDYRGGELSFIRKLHDDGTHDGIHHTIRPKAGSAVLFYQGVEEFAHFPHKIQEGSKNILRADVLYRFLNSTTADVGCSQVN